MTEKLALALLGFVMLGIVALGLVAACNSPAKAAETNVITVDGCVYNEGRREWVCPSPGRGSIQSPGDSGSGDAGASSGSGDAGASGASSGCK